MGHLATPPPRSVSTRIIGALCARYCSASGTPCHLIHCSDTLTRTLTFLSPSLSLSLRHIRNAQAERICLNENTTLPHYKLTQNIRLKANIRYLTHISPPDSAAMAGLEQRISLLAPLHVIPTWRRTEVLLCQRAEWGYFPTRRLRAPRCARPSCSAPTHHGGKASWSFFLSPLFILTDVFVTFTCKMFFASLKLPTFLDALTIWKMSNIAGRMVFFATFKQRCYPSIVLAFHLHIRAEQLVIAFVALRRNKLSIRITL